MKQSDGNHHAQAIMNAQAATKATDGKAIAEHAQVALTHAQAALESTEVKAHLKAAR